MRGNEDVGLLEQVLSNGNIALKEVTTDLGPRARLRGQEGKGPGDQADTEGRKSWIGGPGGKFRGGGPASSAGGNCEPGERSLEQSQSPHRHEGHPDDVVFTDTFAESSNAAQCLGVPICPVRVWNFEN